MIEGYGQASTIASGQLLAAADRGRDAQVQLGLPGLSPPHTALICATISYLVETRGVRDWLRRHGVRKIVDLRVAPSYRGLGLRQRAFAELAEELGATYIHLVALSNRFVGESWHAERYRQRLERHFEDNRELVEQLRRMVDDGPVLLIFAERSPLERELLLRALERVSPKFETQVLTGGVSSDDQFEFTPPGTSGAAPAVVDSASQYAGYSFGLAPSQERPQTHLTTRLRTDRRSSSRENLGLEGCGEDEAHVGEGTAPSRSSSRALGA